VARQELEASLQHAARVAALQEQLSALVSVAPEWEDEPARTAPGLAALRQQEAPQQRVSQRVPAYGEPWAER